MIPGRQPKWHGFTLIELLVTIALIAILGSLAAPSFQAVWINSASNAAASDLMLAVQQAQSEALKRSRTVVVEPVVSADWTSGWNVYVRLSGGSSYNAGSDTLIVTREALPANVSVSVPSSNCNSRSVLPNGFMADNGTGCRVIFGSATTGVYRHVLFSRIGRARVCTSNTAATTSCSD